MIKKLKRFFFTLTGGRPMELVQKNVFVDHIQGGAVHKYRDRLNGQYYLAHSSTALFRTKAYAKK